jgi:hypothetical protein
LSRKKRRNGKQHSSSSYVEGKRALQTWVPELDAEMFQNLAGREGLKVAEYLRMLVRRHLVDRAADLGVDPDTITGAAEGSWRE